VLVLSTIAKFPNTPPDVLHTALFFPTFFASIMGIGAAHRQIEDTQDKIADIM
jgi:hypothetical protein